MNDHAQSFITPPKPISLLQHVVGGHDDHHPRRKSLRSLTFFFAARSTPCGPFLIVLSAHVDSVAIPDSVVPSDHTCNPLNSSGSTIMNTSASISRERSARRCSVLITVAFYMNEMDEGELGHDEHVI